MRVTGVTGHVTGFLAGLSHVFVRQISALGHRVTGVTGFLHVTYMRDAGVRARAGARARGGIFVFVCHTRHMGDKIKKIKAFSCDTPAGEPVTRPVTPVTYPQEAAR